MVSRSRFVTTIERAATPAEAHAAIERTRRELPDATHHCWAFVAGPPGSTTHIGLSDAGEPKGTAGRPMLTVLLNGGVGEVVAVCSRWFGGTKLGTGGLARAYTRGVQHALASLATELKVERVRLELEASYPHVAALRNVLAQLDASVLAESWDAGVRWLLAVPVEREAELAARVADATAGQARLRRSTAPTAPTDRAAGGPPGGSP